MINQTVYYRYLGTNGVIESPVHLEDIYYVRLIELVADARHQLTDGNVTVTNVRVPEDEVSKWHEIPLGANN